MSKTRVQIFFGTRPEAIKLAPLIRHCLAAADRFETIVCHSQQHVDLAQPVVDYFELPIHEAMGLMRPDQSLTDLHARCLQGAEGVIAKHDPDCVVVQGDTTTAMAAATAAFYLRKPIVHVEAGLRTGRIDSPWPEEFNRRVITPIANLNCAPTTRAAQVLLNEGVAPERVLVTGNTVIDALLWTLAREQSNSESWMREYPMLQERPLVLVTGHRRENFGENMQHMCQAIVRLAREHRHVVFLYPVHLNPNVQRATKKFLEDEPNVFLVKPASYAAFVWLMYRSTLILTDSGGIQEESVTIQKPTLVLRDTTERPEAIESGIAKLVGTDEDRIVHYADAVLRGDTREFRITNAKPFGDGTASEQIAQRILTEWGTP